MDRLIVGDVGYGKTEVALRAAALVALAERQALDAVPKTMLVRQHIETFLQRFEGTGMVVAGPSRFSAAAEKKRSRRASPTVRSTSSSGPARSRPRVCAMPS